MIRAILAFALAASAAGHAGAQISNDVVRIAVLNDQAGLYADVSGAGSVESARLAAEDFGGRVAGKPIEIIFADHANKADVGAGIARRWLDADNVDVIVDANNSAVALAIQDLVRERNKVFLMGGVGATSVTNEKCSPNGFAWVFDTYALANSTARAVVAEGGKSWFFVTADYAFGHSLERDAGGVVEATGGKVVGSVRAPLNAQDFSSFLLNAKASGAQVIGFANSGLDTVNAIRQAREFDIGRTQRLAAFLPFITDIHALGTEAAQGLYLTTAFYWDYDDETRAFARRFAKRFRDRMPTMVQAGVYSAVRHYLRAIEAAGTDEATAVIAKMKQIPLRDAFARNATIRDDGRVVHDMFLVQVKSPAESKGPWDLYKIIRRIPAEEAFRPLSESKCSLVRK